MPKASDIRVVEATITFEPCAFRSPLKFGGRVMDKSRLMNVQVTVESRGKKHSTGMGSMPVGNIWAWPSDAIEPDKTEQAMMAFAEELVDLCTEFDQFEHPLDLMFDLPSMQNVTKVVVDDQLINGEGPPLLIYSDQSAAAGS